VVRRPKRLRPPRQGRHIRRIHLFEPLHLLKRAGIGCLAITGRAEAHKRAAFVRQHSTDPNVKVLLGTSVVEAGLNLQYASLVMSVVETYVPQRGEQLIGRIARPGSAFSEVDYAVVHMDIRHEDRKAARSNASPNWPTSYCQGANRIGVGSMNRQR
jgi:superfamily II DNA or RNA helicase